MEKKLINEFVPEPALYLNSIEMFFLFDTVGAFGRSFFDNSLFDKNLESFPV